MLYLKLHITTITSRTNNKTSANFIRLILESSATLDADLNLLKNPITYLLSLVLHSIAKKQQGALVDKQVVHCLLTNAPV